jgi:hypothetical protein
MPGSASAAQDGQTAEPVGEDVVEHQDQRGSPADRVGDQAGQPERSVDGESLAQ